MDWRDKEEFKIIHDDLRATHYTDAIDIIITGDKKVKQERSFLEIIDNLFCPFATGRPICGDQ
ncbi:MAG: hypothetical protein PVI26_06660 [Chitinispirillia bacterium]|jgi:hypothetical protein